MNSQLQIWDLCYPQAGAADGCFARQRMAEVRFSALFAFWDDQNLVVT